MENNERNYKRDNQTAKEAIRKENEFLKDYVMDKGADAEMSDKQNMQTNIERSHEE